MDVPWLQLRLSQLPACDPWTWNCRLLLKTYFPQRLLKQRPWTPRVHVNAQSLFSRFLEVHCQGTRPAFTAFSNDPAEISLHLCRYAAVFIITHHSVSRCQRTRVRFMRIGCVQTSVPGSSAKIPWFVHVYHYLSTFPKHIQEKMAMKWGTLSPMPKQRPAARLRGCAAKQWRTMRSMG